MGMGTKRWKNNCGTGHRMSSGYNIAEDYQGSGTSSVRCPILQDKSGWTDGMLMLRRINIP
jgi:hypothetical protein